MGNCIYWFYTGIADMVSDFPQQRGDVMSIFKGNEELEVQIYNPVLNESLYLAQDLCDPATPDVVLHRKGELLTVHVLHSLLSVGYEFIPCKATEN
jgi:hypothetical protein